VGVDRRQLLTLCAALVAAKSASLYAEADAIVGLKPAPEFLSEFARHYAAVLPHDTDPDELRRDLFTAGVADESALSARIQNDFKTFNTVPVNGWLMSRTEARLLYLLAVS